MNVSIKREHFSKLMAYAKLCQTEVGGMGKIKMDDDGNLEVTNVYISKQFAHGTTCELDATDLGRLEYEARNDEGEMALWWHSHVDMGVSPSLEDDKTMQKMSSHGRCLRLIINRSGDTRADYSCRANKQAMTPAIVTSATVMVVDSIDADSIKAELDEFVLPFPVKEPRAKKKGYECVADDGIPPIPKHATTRKSGLSPVRSFFPSVQPSFDDDQKRIPLNPSFFAIQQVYKGVMLSRGYFFAISHSGNTAYVATYDAVNKLVAVPFDQYAAMTYDSRSTIEGMVDL